MNLYRKLTTFLVACMVTLAILCAFGMLFTILHELAWPTGDVEGVSRRMAGFFTAFGLCGLIAMLSELVYSLLASRND